MIEKTIKNPSIMISDASLDRREDIYAYTEFGKIVSRYVITDQMYSDNFWSFMKGEFSIKKENITMFCDIHSDVKNRIEKIYKYIVRVDKPFKLIFQFYDEEKVIDEKIYETEDEQKNKISDLIIHFDYDAFEYVEKLLEMFRTMVSLPSINKTFYIISSSSVGYELRPANVKEFDIKLDLNYGETFIDKYVDIVDKLKNNKHGLFLFHGEPGCGKCVDGSTIVTLRNKNTGIIENISIEEFEKLL